MYIKRDIYLFDKVSVVMSNLWSSVWKLMPKAIHLYTSVGMKKQMFLYVVVLSSETEIKAYTSFSLNILKLIVHSKLIN